MSKLLSDLSMTRLIAVVVLISFVGLPLNSQAAEYCYRHFKNDSNSTFIFTMENTHGDTRDYPIPPRTTVAYAIPDDNSESVLRVSKNDYGIIFDYTPRKSAFDHMFDGTDMCHIDKVQGLTLDYDYPGKSWLTVNEPANGDIHISRDYDSNLGLLSPLSSQ